MLPYFTKFFFIILCNMYISTKILNINTLSALNFLKHSIFILLSSFFLSLFSQVNFKHTTILIWCITFIFIKSIYNIKSLIAINTSIISFSISYIALTISGFIIGMILTPFCNNISTMPSICYVPIASILQFTLVILLFQIKRLQHGMPFIYRISTTYMGLILSLLVILVFLLLKLLNSKLFPYNLFTLLFIFLLAIALLIWWRHKITQSYVEKLRVDEVELLYKEISDKDLEIEKLHAHNEQLSGIIHKDNKLIPAMKMAVRNYLQTAALMKPEDAKQTGAELLSKLERMAEERTGIIHTYQENFSYRQRSGLISIDAIVDYMENRASTLGIEYHYQFDKTLKEMLPAFITEDDAMHLLSDLIENAIIAATHSEKKNIHIHIGFIRSILFIDISDSGIPFTTETYEKFGNIQYTTHAEHGGSGIGLMDIAKLKRQYQFSLQIYEYPENETIYTKKIRILFDRKSHYLIQSYRAKELRSAILRNDLHVIPYSDKEKP